MRRVRIIFEEIYLVLTFGYLIAYLFLGVVFSLTIPPFQVPGEDTHLSQAWYLLGDGFSFRDSQGEQCGLIYGMLEVNESNSGNPGKFARWLDAKSQCVSTSVLEGKPKSVFNYLGVYAARILVSGEDSSPLKFAIMMYLSRIFQGVILLLLFIRFYICLRHHPRYVVFGFLLIISLCLHPNALLGIFSVSTNSNRILLAVYSALILIFRRHIGLLDLVSYSLIAYAVCVVNPAFIIIVFSTMFGLLLLNHGMLLVPMDKLLRRRAVRISISLCALYMLLLGAVGMYSFLSTTQGSFADTQGVVSSRFNTNLKFLSNDWKRAIWTVVGTSNWDLPRYLFGPHASYGAARGVLPSEYSSLLITFILWVALSIELLLLVARVVILFKENRCWFTHQHVRWLRANWKTYNWSRGTASGYGIGPVIFRGGIGIFVIRLFCASCLTFGLFSFWIANSLAIYLTVAKGSIYKLTIEHYTSYIPVFILLVPLVSIVLPGYSSEETTEVALAPRQAIIVRLILAPLLLVVLCYAVGSALDIVRAYY